MTETEFKIFLRPLWSKLYGYAMTILREPSDVEDCLQEVCVKLWQMRQRLGEMENPEGYCVVAVKRSALDALRKRTRASEVPVEEAITEAPPDESFTRRLDDRDSLRSLLMLMDELPEGQRKVVRLSGVAGLSNKEIEEVTGYSPDNVRVLLSRGRKRLKELWDRTVQK